MRQRPGIPATGKTSRPDNPGKAADAGPDRPHIWTHYFVGANAVVTRLTGGSVNAEMAIERLKHAADLEVITDGHYERNTMGQVRVKVINSGAGHYLPTGLTEVREMWLAVAVKDASGQVLLDSGWLDESGKVDADAVMYNTVIGNKDGPVMNVALADRILYDYRIPPKGFRVEKYAFMIPDNVQFPIRIEAVLNYRSASQPFANAIMGDKAPEIPVIDMVRATADIVMLE
jgi:hypothetical protein